MNDWMDDLARALGVEPLAPDEMGAVLRLARDVAHGVERKFAPLSTYLLGVGVGSRASGGTAREEAFRAAVTAARSSLPAREGEPASQDRARGGPRGG